MSLLFPLLAILFLILINGVFVAAEFAIIGVRPSLLEQLASEGNAAARRVQAVLRDRAHVDRYIATAQLGITMASLGLGMYSASSPTCTWLLGKWCPNPWRCRAVLKPCWRSAGR